LRYSSSINALKKTQEWLEQRYPEKKNRIRCIQLDMSFPSLRVGLEGTLDLRDFGGLRLLNCSGHKLTRLEFGEHPQLEHFYCDTNQLTRLDIRDYPELVKIDCSKNKLNDLSVVNCHQLTEFYCSNNCLTSFDFESFNEKKLTRLDLKNNCLLPLELSKLSSFINLEFVDVGSNNREKISDGFYNQFYGSLKSLKKLKRLKFLNIEATDIDRGLEYLPESLEEFYCTSYGTWTKVGKIEEILREYPDSSEVRGALSVPLFSRYQDISAVDFSPNYFDNLQRWRRVNADNNLTGRRVAVDDEELFPLSRSFSCEDDSNQSTSRIELELNQLIDKIKTKLNVDL
jgi:Leucine-rich repeat (LRR) protein